MLDISHELFIAWAAGFYEGEGSCGVYNTNHGTKKLQVSLHQNDPKALHALVGEFGGTVCKGSRKTSIWQVYNDKARLFLEEIQKYVVSDYKTEQLESALSTYEKYLKERNEAKLNTRGRLVNAI